MTFTQLFEDRYYQVPEIYSDSVTEFEMKEKIVEACKRMYLTFDMTAREICTVYDCEFKPEYNQLFAKLFGPKGKCHGGARKHAGNKTGHDMSYTKMKKVS